MSPTARKKVNPEGRWIPGAIRKVWARAEKKAGLGFHVKPYEALKHSSGTCAPAEGKSMKEVQRAFRHRDRKATERYAKWAHKATLEPPTRTQVVPTPKSRGARLSFILAKSSSTAPASDDAERENVG